MLPLFIKGKKNIQTYLALCGKVILAYQGQIYKYRFQQVHNSMYEYLHLWQFVRQNYGIIGNIMNKLL